MTTQINSCSLCLCEFPNFLANISEGSQFFAIITELVHGLDQIIPKDFNLCPECLKFAQLALLIKQTAIENSQVARDNMCWFCLRSDIVDNSVFFNDTAEQMAYYVELRHIISVLDSNFDDGENPSLCSNCWESVKKIYLYKKRCIIKIENFELDTCTDDLITDDMLKSEKSQILSGQETFDNEDKIDIKCELLDLDQSDADCKTNGDVLLTLNNVKYMGIDVNCKNEDDLEVLDNDVKIEVKHEDLERDLIETPLVDNNAYFKCSKCSYQTKKRHRLNEHMMTHDENRNFKCNKCSYQAKTKNSLFSHMIVHNEKYDYNCSKCSYQSKTKRNLIRHMVIHEDKYDFKCSKCNHQAKTKVNLMRHMVVHKDTYDFKCSKCSFQAKRKSELTQHMLVHDENYYFQCTKCSYQTKRKQHLTQHMMTHNDKRNFKCNECSYQAKTKSGLLSHMIVHNEKYDFKCNKCGYQFKRKMHLFRHMAIHEKKYDFELAQSVNFNGKTYSKRRDVETENIERTN